MRVYKSPGQPKGPQPKRSGRPLPAVPPWPVAVDTPPGRPFPALRGDQGITHPAIHLLPPDAGPARGSPGVAWGNPGPEGSPGSPSRCPAPEETFCRGGSGQGPGGHHRLHPGPGRDPRPGHGGARRVRDGSGVSRAGEQSPAWHRRWGEPCPPPGCPILCKLRQMGLQPSSPSAESRGAGGRRGERRLTRRGTLRGGREAAGA